MEKQQFKNLQTGDLVEWNHIPASPTPNIIGVVVAKPSRLISTTSVRFLSGTTQDSSLSSG